MSESTNSQFTPVFKQSSGSTPLWAHLLRKDISTPPADPGITITPTAPLDKNGTSMRLLLYDTQANFEKFSERVDKLTAGVDDARKEVVLVKKLFQQEHEQLEKDMVDLVQRSVGEPAQALKVEDLRKDVQSTDRRLEFLDKRMDALHALIQTQTQTLQIQSQALQTLQDQQGTIITALMPLLPLLQAIPLHIESARVNLKELLQMHTHTNPPVIAPIAPLTQSQTGKRSSPALHSGGPPSSPTEISAGRKRPRIESESVSAVRPQEPQSSPILSSQIQSRSYYAPINRRQTTQVVRHQSLRFRSPLSAIPLIHRKNSRDATPPVQQQASQVLRFPLSDLPTPTDNVLPNKMLSNSVAAQNLMQHSTVHNTASPTLPALTPLNRRPSKTLPTLTSSSRPPPSPVATKLYNKFSNKEPERPSHVDDIFSSDTSQVRQVDPEPRPSLVAPGSTGFRDSPSFQTSLPAKTASKRPPFSSGSVDRSHPSVRPTEAPVPRNDDDNAGAIGNSLLVSSEVPAPRSKPLSIKDRRASFRNTHKRFIPLDDDDDDNEE